MPKKSVRVNASVLKRLIAFIVDMLLLNVFILFPFQNVFFRGISDVKSLALSFEYYSTTNLMIVALFVSLVSILYFTLFERKIGQTPGKMLLRIYVISDGREFKPWQAWVRSLFLIPFFPFILLWIIEPIVVFFNHDNKRLLEIVSKTKTVEVRPL